MRYMIYGLCSPSVEEVCDSTLFDCLTAVRTRSEIDCIWSFRLRQLNEAKCDDDVRCIVGDEQFDFRFDLGFGKPAQTFTLRDRDALVSAAAKNNVSYTSLIRYIIPTKPFRCSFSEELQPSTECLRE